MPGHLCPVIECEAHSGIPNIEDETPWLAGLVIEAIAILAMLMLLVQCFRVYRFWKMQTRIIVEALVTNFISRLNKFNRPNISFQPPNQRREILSNAVRAGMLESGLGVPIEPPPIVREGANVRVESGAGTGNGQGQGEVQGQEGQVEEAATVEEAADVEARRSARFTLASSTESDEDQATAKGKGKGIGKGKILNT